MSVKSDETAAMLTTCPAVDPWEGKPCELPDGHVGLHNHPTCAWGDLQVLGVTMGATVAISGDAFLASSSIIRWSKHGTTVQVTSSLPVATSASITVGTLPSAPKASQASTGPAPAPAEAPTEKQAAAPPPVSKALAVRKRGASAVGRGMVASGCEQRRGRYPQAPQHPPGRRSRGR